MYLVNTSKGLFYNHSLNLGRIRWFNLRFNDCNMGTGTANALQNNKYYYWQILIATKILKYFEPNGRRNLNYLGELPIVCRLYYYTTMIYFYVVIAYILFTNLSLNGSNVLKCFQIIFLFYFPILRIHNLYKLLHNKHIR